MSQHEGALQAEQESSVNRLTAYDSESFPPKVDVVLHPLKSELNFPYGPKARQREVLSLNYSGKVKGSPTSFRSCFVVGCLFPCKGICQKADSHIGPHDSHILAVELPL